MPILTYPTGPLDVNCHIYHNNKDAIIIDPAEDTRFVMDKLKELGVKLQAILLTHMHFDHVYGCAALRKETGLPVFAGQGDMDIAEALMSSAKKYGLPPVAEFEAQALEAGKYDFGSIQCTALHVPGHSPGSLAYYVPAEQAVFTGDVLFYRSIGRTDLGAGDFDLLAKSIREQLYTLPPETKAFCGHGLETSIGDEMRLNPFVN